MASSDKYRAVAVSMVSRTTQRVFVEEPSDENYRVIAEDEIRLIRKKADQPTFAFARIGNYEWECSIDEENRVLINFKRIIEDAGKANEKIDADFYDWSDEKGEFKNVKNLTSTSMKEDKFFFRDKEVGNKPYGEIFKNGFGTTTPHVKTSSLKFSIIIRIKRQRSTFPDFTTKEGHFRPITGILKIGDQQFHVNKEYLAWISPTYFNPLFNGHFVEGSQEQVRINGMDPTAFHEFLLVVNTHLHKECVLPDEKTVAALLEFAQFFQIEFLKQLCAECLVLAREMTVDDRLAITKKYGLFRAYDLILADVGDINKIRLIMQKERNE